jgi:hypothetical protein
LAAQFNPDFDPESQNFYDIQAEYEAYYATHDRGKGSGYKQFKRWESLWGPVVYPTGEFVNSTEKSWDEYHRYMSNLDQSRGTHNGYWTSIGPYSFTEGHASGGGMGRVNCIAFDPTNSSTIYVGTPAGAGSFSSFFY